MKILREQSSSSIVDGIIGRIIENKEYLSEIDGAIGDGDHGINMSKGMHLAREALNDADTGLSAAFTTLGKTLVNEIGGSMGPLYGGFFRAFGRSIKGVQTIAPEEFASMLQDGYESVTRLGNAKVGDKTIVDTLEPAVQAFAHEVRESGDFEKALVAMAHAAEEGKNSTKDLVAKIGRASRLGERSRGVLDAGATSCWLILDELSERAQELLVDE